MQFKKEPKIVPKMKSKMEIKSFIFKNQKGPISFHFTMGILKVRVLE